MKLNKGLKFGALLAVMLIMSMALVPAVSAESPISIESPAIINESVGDSTKKTNDFLSPSKEVQQLLFDAIEASNLTDVEKKDLAKELKNIWSGKSELTLEEQQRILIKAGELFSETQVGILWRGGQHSDIARASGVKSQSTTWAVPQQYLDTLYNYADDPDWFDPLSEHAWHVDTNSGDAPAKVKTRADNARDYIKNQNNPSAGYKQLAYSMHYMADVAVPYHTNSTGAVFDPTAHPIMHVNYESFVNNEWNTGHKFNETVQGDWYYYYITDPEATAKSVASGSYQYYSYILAKMLGDGDWENDPTVVSYTRESLKFASRANLGLINYVNR